jgi:hypothetical protein
MVIIAIDKWRFGPEDDELLAPAIAIELIVELSSNQFEELQPKNLY